MDGLLQTASGDPIARHLTDYASALARIQCLQLPDGAIPWFEDGPWDPWNHVEAAMALTAMGDIVSARRAYAYLNTQQRPDGAWLGDYGNALPMVDRDFISREPAPQFLDANFCAYPAVGITHYLLATGDIEQVSQWWPMVAAAMRFVLLLQRRDGAFIWSQEARGTKDEDALLAGNACIAKSLECCIYLARKLGEPADIWQAAYTALCQALRYTPEVFDRRRSGERYAMDWYYPVLAGVLEPAQAHARLEAQWSRFVQARRGCLCVSDQPWITVAESCELALALVSIGARDRAATLLGDIADIRDDRGVYWMGWQYEEALVWPREQPAWTQGAVILAADALYGLTAHSQLLVHCLLQAPQYA